MNDHRPSCVFTSKTCGYYWLNVYRVWTVLVGLDTENWHEWNPLEADHWHIDFKEMLAEEKDRDYQFGRGGFSEDQKGSSSLSPQDYLIYQLENTPGNDRFFVN